MGSPLDGSLMRLETIPTPARLLGLAGLIPFAATAIEVIFARKIVFGPGPALYALQIYGAVILSFMGGAQWGLAVAQNAARETPEDWRRYAVSVLPSFVAWAGLWFTGQTGLLLLAGGFLALLAYDFWTIRNGEVAPWYGRLRIMLTAGVVTILAATAMLGPF
jgi:hypothetical protein